MRTTLFIFATLFVVLLNACTEGSPFVIGLEAAEEISSEDGIVFHSSPSDTTVLLQVDSSSFDAHTGVFSIYLTGSHGYEIIELAVEQSLDFTNGQGSNRSLSFDVLSFTDRGDKASIVFELDGQPLSGLQLADSQAIIVEEIVVN